MRLNIKLCILAFGVLISCRQQYPQGERIYLTYCVNCHMQDGTGLGMVIPPLTGSDYLKANLHNIPCIIRYGVKGGLVVNGIRHSEPMPAFSNLNEVELSNVINYINTAWDNRNRETSPAEVASALEQCADK